MINLQSYFSIPIPSRGEIVLKKALDYESVQKMYIDVIAKVRVVETWVLDCWTDKHHFFEM